MLIEDVVLDRNMSFYIGDRHTVRVDEINENTPATRNIIVNILIQKGVVTDTGRFRG